MADFLSAQIKTNLKAGRVRADTFGYLQRSFAGYQSAVDVDEALRCGRQAVIESMKEQSGSIAIKRITGGDGYAIELFRTELSNVAEKTKFSWFSFLSQTVQLKEIMGLKKRGKCVMYKFKKATYNFFKNLLCQLMRNG